MSGHTKTWRDIAIRTRDAFLQHPAMWIVAVLLLIHIVWSATSRASLSRAIAEIRASTDEHRQDKDRPGPDQAQAQTPTSEQRAVEVALQKAEVAREDEDLELAEVYILNAVQRVTNNIEPLQRYFELATFAAERENVDLDLVDRASSFLGSALIRVSPDQVPTVRNWLEKLAEIRAAAIPSEASLEPSTDIEIEARWDALKNEEFAADADSLQDVADRVEKLETFASELDPLAHADLISEVEAKITLWRQAQQILNTRRFVVNCLKNLETVDLASEAAVAMAQTAENALPTLWGIDLSQFPTAIRTQVTNLPTELKEKVERIADARSEEPLQAIKMLKSQSLAYVSAKKTDNQKYDTRCNYLESQINTARAKLRDIPSKRKLAEAEKHMQEMMNILRHEREKQHHAYQLDVLARCAEAFKGFNSEWAISEADALKYFNNQMLYNIDQASLTPEVSRCFNDLLGKLFAELSPEQIVACETKMIKEKKKRLEEF